MIAGFLVIKRILTVRLGIHGWIQKSPTASGVPSDVTHLEESLTSFLVGDLDFGVYVYVSIATLIVHLLFFRPVGFVASSAGNGLVGTIPAEISVLNMLENFVAVTNLIGGTLPSSMGSMSNMKRLILQTNLLGGSIPDGFLARSPMELMILSDNQFLGDIPSSLGGIVTLTQLQLSNNRFEGTIPKELGNLELLQTLGLSENIRLLGSIPSEVFGMANLNNLYVDGCKNIGGQLDANLGGLSSIEILRLGGTGLQGSLPSTLFALTTLVELDLSDAGFSGTLSEDFSLLADSLQRLYLQGNSFSGTIPTAFDFMSVLSESMELATECNLYTQKIDFNMRFPSL